MDTDNLELDNLDAPLEVIERFNGDVEKIKAFQKAVAEDAMRESAED